ncbi:efflux RND transporter periplasmic adaptor subunit [Filimonas effusa]|uniref:Efflux RND transporter periplasmic adaptor subunit n=1 Tax=Filimonas effusa TaxID=2508721 RepID=A0A4Q1DAN4_9BACT|nr:efflux RND transporter periplasmic adaptor subunit [Filimonas effusa]RXK85825.1 efflux RND transporter periplasmic adaptor subunit [Filimonas effusa]
MNSRIYYNSLLRQARPLIAFTILAIGLYSCTTSAGSESIGAPPPQELPVLTLTNTAAVTYQEFSATIEGTVNVELRPQVDGYLEKIYVDEGAYVTKGQLLFKINDRSYASQFTTAEATAHAAQANMEKAAIELNRIRPLVQNNVVSDVQLKAAQASYEAAKASFEQAQSATNNAGISLGYTLIKAPVSGYIGRIPFKAGSLVGRGEALPLTVLSEVNNVYAYFSMSESDFLQFTSHTTGKTVDEKIKGLPPVELMLADKSIYTEKGKVEMVQGQFDKSMGTISFRAVFANANGILRSGNTGKVRIPHTNAAVLAVPQQATYELQDKVYVFTVADSNKVVSKPIGIAGTSGVYYLVDKGLNAGETIVFTGLDRLRDGAVIRPLPLSADSLRKAMPL